MSEMSKERTNYIRTSVMYAYLTREVLFKVFKYLIKSDDITGFLSSLEQQNKLRELFQRHILNQPDYNLVSCQVLSLEKFDISLLVRLILNLCKENIPQRGWETQQHSKDESLGADLLRLRDVRNKIIGHRADAKLSEEEYEKTWAKIKAILMRVVELVDSQSSEQFEQRIDGYKRLIVDTENVEVKRLLDELLNFKADFDHLQEKVEELSRRSKEFEEYFKITPEIFVRYIKLLLDGGRIVLCGIMKTKLGDQNLSDILKIKKEMLKRNIIDEKYSICLSQESCSDYKNWDIFLLAFVLLFMYDKYLSQKEIMYIERIISAREKYAALALQSLDTVDFLTNWIDLINCLNHLSINIAEDDKLQVEYLIERYKKKDEGVCDADEYFKQLRIVDVKTLNDVYKETIKKLGDMLNQLRQKDIKFEDGFVLEFKLLTLCENEEIKKEAEDLLEINLKASMQKSDQPSGSIRRETDKVVAIIAAHPDVTPVEVKRKCIICSFKCFTPGGLLHILHVTDGDQLRSTFRNIANELHYIYGHAFLIQGKCTLESVSGVSRMINKYKTDTHADDENKEMSARQQLYDEKMNEYAIENKELEGNFQTISDTFQTTDLGQSLIEDVILDDKRTTNELEDAITRNGGKKVKEMAQMPDHRINLFRLQVSIIDGGLLVLRNIIDQILTAKGITLRACLNNEKATITRLKSRGVITQVQYDILFPTGGQVPTTSEMDFTLITCLLRCLKCFGLNKKFDWNTKPISTDLTVEADICRLKAYRNEICHVPTTTRIQPYDLENWWNDIEQILFRRSSQAPNIHQVIADSKDCPLDPEEEKRLQEEVKRWKDYEADVDRLNEEMKQMQTNVIEVKKEVEAELIGVKKEIEAITERQDAGLTVYLKKFYSKSESFNTFCHELEGLEGFSLRIGPTFEKIDIKCQDVTEMNQNEALIEILQIPYTLEGIQRLEPILVVAKDTTASANHIVSVWLNNVDNKNYPMNLNSLDGVFLLKIADSDDVTDLNIMMEERFKMKKAYYSQRILIIFECIHTDLFKLKKIYNLACSCMFQACKFIIITQIEKQVVLNLKLDIQSILIADKIDALHVVRTQFEERIDGHKLGKSIDQIVSKREGISWQKDAITKVCFENIQPLNETATIRVPKHINNIEFHGCSHKIQVLHCAKHLDISVSNRFSNILPEHIVTPTLTTITIYFKSLEHVFHKSVYESFAFNISKATHILSLRLCNMSFGRKSITVELKKQGIEQIRHSIESNEDYCRFGARILGPCLGKISFDKEDVESENNSSFVKQIMLDLICYELVKSNRSVSECYPSQMECGTIKLICFVNDDVRIDSFKGFLLVKKDCNNINKESLFAENSCDREDNTVVNATVEEFEDINETLSFHAEALMASHRNLEAVKVSFVQPKDMTLVQSKLCIVLYCRAKGCIPYGDVRFPRTLIHPFKNKSFRTDVREGYFIACPYRTGHSTDFNKELAIGCSIGQYEQKPAATLGPFVNIKETNETCFLTVRHVFGPPSIKEDCLVGAKVVQPADYHLSPDEDKLQNRHCGDVLVSHIGGQIDAALVKISAERLPGRGQFIRLTREDLDWTGLTEQPMFNDGAFLDAKTLTVKNLATRRIIKIGCTTSLTKGTLSTTAAGIVRETLEYTSLETLYNGSKEKYQIKSQIMVESYYKKVFCQAGDSGSAVFLVEDDNHLNCIGMVIGFIWNDHTAIVTPIDNILQILGHKLKKTLELKKFRETDEMDES